MSLDLLKDKAFENACKVYTTFIEPDIKRIFESLGFNYNPFWYPIFGIDSDKITFTQALHCTHFNEALTNTLKDINCMLYVSYDSLGYPCDWYIQGIINNTLSD